MFSRMIRAKSHLASILASTCLIMAPVVAAPAFAAGDTGGETTAKNRTIDMSGLVLPVELDGKLVNYLFVSAMIEIAPKYDHWEVRENAHVYRDALLKAAHKNTVGLEGSPMKLDTAAFEVLVSEVFDGMLGPDSVSAVEIMAVDSQQVFIDPAS